MFKIKDFRKQKGLTSEQQEELEACLLKATQEGRVLCSSALEIAKSLGIPVPVVGQTADQLNIRIEKCLLGCF